jgi:hypothetical protein
MLNPITEQAGNFSLQPINAIEAVSRAEIDMQISTAKKYPRNIAQVKSEMLDIVQLDEETAAACFYSLPRGGKNIQGPSIRLAEVALSCFGNIRAGSRIIETVTDGGNPYVTIQAVCHDLQKNVAVSIEKRRRIVGKKTKGGVIDEDDINLAANAGSAIALRDAIFKVVPGALIRPVYDAAKKVAIGDARTLSDRRARAMEAFQKMGVSADRVLASVEKNKLEEVTLDDLEVLIGTFTAIKEGSVSIENAFPPVPQKTKETGKVEKPDFGETKPMHGETAEPVAAGSEQSDETLAPEKRQRRLRSDAGQPRGPRGIKSSGMPAGPDELSQEPAQELVEEPPHDRLRAALRECNYDWDDFVSGLKLIEFPGVDPDLELLEELSDETCEEILGHGPEDIMRDVRDARWMKGMK